MRVYSPFIMGVTSGECVEKEPLNRGVWLTSDLSRVEARTQLQAGSRQGTTDLIVNVQPKGNRMWGYVGVDNGGYRYTGRYQYSAFVNYASPFRQGDQLSVGGVRSNGGMWSGSVSYVTPVVRQGEKIGISYARSHYSLGGAFTALGYVGDAETLSVWWQHNFRRSRNFNLYGTIRRDWKDLDESAERLSYRNPKRANNWVFGINGDSIDNFWTGGRSTLRSRSMPMRPVRRSATAFRRVRRSRSAICFSSAKARWISARRRTRLQTSPPICRTAISSSRTGRT